MVFIYCKYYKNIDVLSRYMILKKIEMFFLESIKYSDSSNERTNERTTQKQWP